MSTSDPKTERGEAPWSPEVAGLLQDAQQLEPWTRARQQKVWNAVEDDLQPRARRVSWTFALAAPALAACALAVLALRSAGPAPALPMGVPAPRTLEVGPDALAVASQGARVRLPQNAAAQQTRELFLDAGELTVELAHQRAASTFSVVTPHLRVVVVGTWFTVLTGEADTLVQVHEGLVRVEAPGGASVLVGAGESIRSTDPRLMPPPALTTEAPAPAPTARAPRAAPPECSAEPSASARRACYERLARGSGLAAQNALYALGLLDRDEGRGVTALARWSEYEARFPAGALAPEVGLAILEQLLADGRSAEALERAERLRDATASPRRAAELDLIRANLLCTGLHRFDEALRAYAQAEQGAGDRVRSEAIFALGSCLDSAGRHDEARAAWSRYRERYPTGPRATEIDRRLSTP